MEKFVLSERPPTLSKDTKNMGKLNDCTVTLSTAIIVGFWVMDLKFSMPIEIDFWGKFT
jgi:hypothetical protein